MTTFKHKTLEERAAEFVGKLGPYEEIDWGEPMGRELDFYSPTEYDASSSSYSSVNTTSSEVQ